MEVSSPNVSKRSGPSVVWIIPLVTALVGGWLIVKTLSEQGPQVTINFKTAEGIEAGKTKVKYKNVEIGVVERIQFDEDFKGVILTAQFNKGTEEFFRRNTRFWVVKPQLSLRGASGLDTLISGAYIEIEPGNGSEQFYFVGLEEAPVVTSDEVGKRIVLITEKLRSIDRGSPVYYQGILAGEVQGYKLGNDSASVYIDVFIKDPFSQLLKGNTRFWNVSGMDVSVGADGFNIRTESMQSLIFGGIAFDTPESMEQSTDELESLFFTLYDDFESIEQYANTKKENFVMFFESSVRGLNIGAAVEFKGIKVGSVLDIQLEFDSEDTSFRIPVLIEIEEERLQASPSQTLQALVELGLRARLQTGSLLTGQLFVDLGMFPDTDIVLSDEDTLFPELPTLPTASFEAITKSVQDFMAQLNELKIDDIGKELLESLTGANKIINAPEVQNSVEHLEVAMESLQSILKKADKADIEATINAAQNALEKLDNTLGLTSKVLSPSSPLHYNAIKLTGELEETARAIRSLVETLERHPQALIFGKDVEEE